MKLKLSLVRLI